MADAIENAEGKTLSFTGIISKSEHKIAKSGKPFGSFVLEDFDGSHEFALFGQDYEKFRAFINSGEFLYIQGTVSKRFDGSRNELRIQKMEPLRTVAEKYFKSIDLIIHVAAVSKNMIHELDSTLQMFPGNKKVNFVFFDPEENMEVKIPYKKAGIEINKALIDQLEQMEGIRHKLN